MRKYLPNQIEPKWQKGWEVQKLYEFDITKNGLKFYNLVELPYPSGDLHLGHWFAFVPPDVLARYKRMAGYNVFFPNGFDAFGLPAENAGIKRGIHPKDWTLSNIDTMTRQFSTMGTMIDWSHMAITCLPEYYRWNQWIFLKMFEKGIAYRGQSLSNWCPKDQTVLANENVEAGRCWRCGSLVEQKMVEQWFLKITDYADKLVWPADPKVDWPESVKIGQNTWIGKSEGKILEFKSAKNNDIVVKTFTTRPETTDGATFLVLAPEHPLVNNFTNKEYKKDIERYIKVVKNETELERKESREKTGVFTGNYVINPVTKKQIPVWIADYVLLGYGTGAIMAVPGVDERDREFAQKFHLPIVKSSLKANPAGENKVYFHLHDWSISRQRYWGTPIPIIHCPNCGLIPVPEEDLPVELPYDVDFTPTGKPPLASNKGWMRVKCPRCNSDAMRDPETMDTFFDSSWYFFRYLDPHFNDGPFNLDLTKKLMPVDIYFGGAEHTLGHTLYARFFTKFFKDLRLIDFDEFALKRIQHGVVLGPDGNRMSKSKGNVVNPDDFVKDYGADTVRIYLCFMMPYDATAPWSDQAISGIYRFLKRVWQLFDKVDSNSNSEKQDLVKMNQTILKISNDISDTKFNTAIASLMDWLNYLSRKDKVSKIEYKTFLLCLAPFAPHITEELWSSLGEKESIHLQKWPVVDEKYLQKEEITIVVQINGKVRDTLTIPYDLIENESDIVNKALKSQRVQKFLEGKKPKKTIYATGKVLSFVV